MNSKELVKLIVWVETAIEEIDKELLKNEKDVLLVKINLVQFKGFAAIPDGHIVSHIVS